MQTIAVYDADGNTLDNLVQWDRDVYVYVEHPDIAESYNFHFFNQHMTESLVVQSFYEGGKLRAKIPNTLLEEPYAIIGYINVTKHDEEKCLYGIRINVIHKPQPSNVITPESQDYIKVEDILDECRDYADRVTAFTMEASTYAILSQSYAVGDTGTRESEETDNSKYYCEEAGKHKDAAAASEQTAISKAAEASGYADAAKQSEDNAKQSEENADESEAQAATSAAAALASQEAALASEQAAAASQKAAAQSESNASDSENEAARLLGEVQTLESQTEADRAEVAENLEKAKEEALKAAASAEAAATSESNASDSENAAAESATNAAASEAGAKEAESNVQRVLNDLLEQRYLISNYEATIPTGQWSESDGLYTTTVSCNGILETDDPFIDIVLGGSYEAEKKIISEWGYIVRIDTSNNTLTVYATKETTVEIPIRVKAVR